MIEPINKSEECQKIHNRPQNPIQIDIHDILEKFPFADVVPIFEQHRR